MLNVHLFPLFLFILSWSQMASLEAMRDDLLRPDCQDNNNVSSVSSFSPLPSEFSAEKRETSLDVSTRADLTDEVFQETLTKNPHLLHLNIRGQVHLNDSSLRHIAKKLNSLESLNVTGCLQLTSLTLEFILGRLKPSLRHIDLGEIPWVTCATFQLLKTKGLEFTPENGADAVLDCSHQMIDDEELGEQIKRHLYVQSLSLKGCRFLTDQALSLLPLLKDLRTLDIQECIGLTAPAVNAALQNTPIQLVGTPFALDFSPKAGITDTDCQEILARNTHIHTLKLTGCSQLTNATLSFLSTRVQGLTNLDLSYCGGFTSEGLAWVRQLSQLSALNLFQCAWLNNTGAWFIGQMGGLQVLTLDTCPSFSPGVLESTLKKMRLKELRIPNKWNVCAATVLRHSVSPGVISWI